MGPTSAKKTVKVNLDETLFFQLALTVFDWGWGCFVPLLTFGLRLILLLTFLGRLDIQSIQPIFDLTGSSYQRPGIRRGSAGIKRRRTGRLVELVCLPPEPC